MRQNLKFTKWALAALAVFMLSCQKGEPEAQATQTASKLPVDVIVATSENLSQEEVISGTIEPRQQVSIVGEIAQKVVRIAFEDGQTVSKGQLLYKLNDSELRAKLNELQAMLNLAKIDLQRYKNLLASETIRQQEYDEALAKYHTYLAKVEGIKFELSKTEIRAPFSGRVGISKIDVGAYVTPGAELVNLQDQSAVTLSFSVPERYVALAQKNNKIYFTTELSSERYSATIVASDAGVDNQNRSLTVQAFATNRKQILKGGMSAKIFFGVVEEGTKGISIPSQALIPGENGYSVFVNQNGIAKMVPVKIGNRTENSATIISGIDDGDHIITSNIMKLMDGTPVEEVNPSIKKS